MATPLVGQSGVYVDSHGLEKAAIVFATHTSFNEAVASGHYPGTEADQIPEGHVALVLFGYSGPSYAFIAPTKDFALNIPDFWVEGKLRGYFEVR
jgi:hypothetical protein